MTHDDANKNITRLLDLLLQTTVRLVELEDGEPLPTRTASGFVVVRDDRHFVVTAGHAIRSGRWWLELDARRSGEPAGLLVPFKSHLVIVAEFALPGIKEVDIAWAEIDLGRLRAELGPDIDEGTVRLSTVHARATTPDFQRVVAGR